MTDTSMNRGRYFKPKFIIQLGLLALIIFFIWMKYQTDRRVASGASCNSRLTGLLLALHEYNEHWGTFPPATSTHYGYSYSWRMELMKVLDPQTFHEYRLDQPWNSPENLKLQDRISERYRCPNAPADAPYATSYLLVRGPGCFYGEDPADAPFFDKSTCERIMIVETARSDIHWMSPVDVTLDEVRAAVESGEAKVIGGFDLVGGHVATVDGRVRKLSTLKPGELIDRLQHSYAWPRH